MVVQKPLLRPSETLNSQSTAVVGPSPERYTLRCDETLSVSKKRTKTNTCAVLPFS